jgi:hypothetical protein
VKDGASGGRGSGVTTGVDGVRVNVARWTGPWSQPLKQSSAPTSIA